MNTTQLPDTKGVDSLINKFPRNENDEKSKLTEIANVFEKNAPADLGISQNDASSQANALKQFANGQMDYATMRMMCG